MKGINRKMRLAHLEKIDPARKMSRFYTICVTPTLFGQWAVVREWGRIGQAGTVRENWLESESAASAAGTKFRRQKERRGYRAL
jgi:predicted DNA-binding WGR domain protein